MTRSGSAQAARNARLAELLRDTKIIPVITIDRVEDAVPLARALVAGGLRLLEITLRTPAAPEAAAAVVAQVPDAVVGIGTVLGPDDLARARALGAQFALSPGATPALLEAAAAETMPVIPGIATASELMRAMDFGFGTCKFFPAVPAGGAAGGQARGGGGAPPRFCPTGGVDEGNFREWLALSNVVVVGGSWIAPTADIRAGAWSAITERARRAVGALRA
jgi:2-dehydro-3-deoxyphosphogluconate aldolase/(4S)-4-hydroxy-2-oxoglutarate aldolase